MFTPHNMSHVTCHVSRVTCHVSRVTCQVSHVTFFFFFLLLLQSGGVCWWRVCYRWSLPRLVFRLFINKNALIPKIYLSRLVVVRFWSLIKANLQEFNFREIGIGKKHKQCQIAAAAESAPCAHFQKLDVGIDKKNSNLDLCVFTWVLWSLFHG